MHIPIASTGFWQVLLGTHVHVCHASLANCEKWSFFLRCICFWHLVARQSQLFYTNLDSTETLCYSFGRDISLYTAALKDNKNDNDQLLLEEVFLDQLHWCSSISDSQNKCQLLEADLFFCRNSASYKAVNLQKVSKVLGTCLGTNDISLVALVNLMKPRFLAANPAARPIGSLTDYNVSFLLHFRK